MIKKISRVRRNIVLYEFYRMFGYDYLFYNAVSYLFFTIVKKLDVSEVMFIAGFSAIFCTIFQIFTGFRVEKLGLKKSMCLGNFFWVIQCLLVIVSNNFWMFVFAEACASFGTCLKGLTETQVLYNTLKKVRKKDKFSKVEGNGVFLYYLLESIGCIFSGTLFEYNNYLPIYITLTTLIISFIISLFFENVDNKKKENIKFNIKQYVKGFKLVLNSKRILSIFFYVFIMSGIIAVVYSTLQKSTILALGVDVSHYTIIYALLIFCVGIGSRYQYKYEGVTKRKTLITIGLFLTIIFIAIGIVNNYMPNGLTLLVITVILLIIHNLFQGLYRISVKKYMNNFTTQTVLSRILSIFYMCEGLGKSSLLFISGFCVDIYGVNNTYIIIGSSVLFLLLIVIYFMQKHLGKDPENYSKKDIFNYDLEEEKIEKINT